MTDEEIPAFDQHALHLVETSRSHPWRGIAVPHCPAASLHEGVNRRGQQECATLTKRSLPNADNCGSGALPTRLYRIEVWDGLSLLTVQVHDHAVFRPCPGQLAFPGETDHFIQQPLILGFLVPSNISYNSWTPWRTTGTLDEREDSMIKHT